MNNMSLCGRLPALALVALLLVSAAPAGEKPVLRIFTWSDYFSPETLAGFEDLHDCVVAIDLFDSNEAMLREIEGRGGEPAYDIITPSSYMASIMRQRGMLAEMDHRLIPNLANLDNAFGALGNDPTHVYSVPYTRTVTGIGYNRRLLADPERSWNIFANPDLAGRCAMIDDMRESVGAALKHLGYSLNSTNPSELAKAEEQLSLWLRNAAAQPQDEANFDLGQGKYAAVHAYNGDIAFLMEENKDLDFFVPREGAAITSDDFVIPANSANRRLAHALINHMFDPANAAQNMADTLYYMPIPKAVGLLDESIRHNPAFAVPDEVLEKCETINDIGESTKLYETLWSRVKARR